MTHTSVPRADAIASPYETLKLDRKLKPLNLNRLMIWHDHCEVDNASGALAATIIRKRTR